MSAEPRESPGADRSIRAAIRRVGELQRALTTAEALDPSLQEDHDWLAAARAATETTNRLIDFAERRWPS